MKDTEPVRCLSSSSSLGRRMSCPGSARAELVAKQVIARTMAPTDDSDDAKEGTLLHWHDAHPEADRSNLTDEQRRVLTRNADIRDKWVAKVRAECGIPDDARVIKITDNRTFWLMDQDGLPWVNPLNGEGFPGHPDFILYFPDYRILIIQDSKFGRLEVPKAEMNYQIRSYVVMFAEVYEVDRGYGAITQPLASDYFHSVVYEKGDLAPAKTEILAGLAKTVPEDAPRIPEEEACRFCDAKVIACPESIELSTNAAVAKVKELSPAELEALWPELKLAKKVIEEAEKRLKFIAKEHPECLSTLALGKEQMNTKIPDAKAAFDCLLESQVLPMDYDEFTKLYLGCCSVSRPDLAAAMSKQLQITEDAAKKLLDATLGVLVEKKPKERSLIEK